MLVPAFEFVQDGERSAQAGGSLHGVLLAVAFQVFGKAMYRFEIESGAFADGAYVVGPMHGE